MTRFPLDYLKLGFTHANFPDLFYPIGIGAFVLLVAQVVLYTVLTRRYHRYPPLVALQEWMLWTGITTFGLLIVAAMFQFSFVFVVLFVVAGVAAYAWARFVRWPPLVAEYNDQLRRQRFFSQAKYKHPEATVRSKRRHRGR